MKRILAFFILLTLLWALSGCELYFKFPEPTYGFAREIPQAEQTLRMQVVQTAENGWVATRQMKALNPLSTYIIPTSLWLLAM